jgi:peptide/nickel transport system substrate-binding protein
MELVPASDRLILRLLFFVIIGGLIFTSYQLNQQFSSVTATKGGTINEAVLGTPRFVNPVLANTRADQDVTSLIYSGLMSIGSNGQLVPEVAEAVTVSDDGLSYNVTLRQDVRFHDGEPLTAEDVVYTIQLAQDPELKSPLRGNWSGVVVEEVGEFELNIFLEEPYAPFVENFTLGIMPEHLWSSLPIEQLPFSQLNTEPVGSGPFRVDRAIRDASGIITSYELVAFSNEDFGPNVQKFIFTFFDQESDIIEALNEGVVDTSGYISTENVSLVDSDTFTIHKLTLPRIFALFYNQNRSPALLDDSVREALSVAINRPSLIDTVLDGYGVPINTPVGILADTVESEEGNLSSNASTTLEQAAVILAEGNWERNELGFWEKEIDDVDTTLSLTIRTSNSELFGSTLDAVASMWRELGVEVITEQFEQTDLVQSVIRPRDFQTLLFGIDMSRSYDLYPFWHSSQQDDPGLNVAGYANISVDDVLEDARIIDNQPERDTAFISASNDITTEHPAAFLFQPEFVYVVNTDVTAIMPARPGQPSDRFSLLQTWHTRSDVLWPIFHDEL